MCAEEDAGPRRGEMTCPRGSRCTVAMWHRAEPRVSPRGAHRSGRAHSQRETRGKRATRGGGGGGPSAGGRQSFRGSASCDNSTSGRESGRWVGPAASTPQTCASAAASERRETPPGKAPRTGAAESTSDVFTPGIFSTYPVTTGAIFQITAPPPLHHPPGKKKKKVQQSRDPPPPPRRPPTSGTTEANWKEERGGPKGEV